MANNGGNNDTELNNFFTMEVNDRVIDVHMDELEKQCRLGQGAFGFVDRMVHRPSGREMAVKVIRHLTSQELAHNGLLNDYTIGERTAECEFIVSCYGAMEADGDIWICMEALDTSLDKFYPRMAAGTFVPEEFMVYIMFSMVSALMFLRVHLYVMHRDVKPGNVLLDRRGRVQMCDFGISGYLQNSRARSNVGTELYLAPERIDSGGSTEGYSVSADVWSLGVSMVEVACRRHPYQAALRSDAIDAILNANVKPSLPKEGPYSPEAHALVARCLVRDASQRASLDALLQDPLITPLFHSHEATMQQFGLYVSERL